MSFAPGDNALMLPDGLAKLRQSQWQGLIRFSVSILALVPDAMDWGFLTIENAIGFDNQ